MRKVLAIRHVPFEDLGSFEPVLKNQGFEILYFEAATGNFREIADQDFDLVIALGGPISVNDAHLFPFIAEEITFLKKRLLEDRPTLGICLGAQLIAAALGAKIYPCSVKEIGWQPLQLTPDGEVSPLRFFDPTKTSMFHWHDETFDLPEGAVSLASTSAVKNQAFSYKSHILGLQFHPEAESLEPWFVGHIAELSAAKIDLIALRHKTEKLSLTLKRCAQEFLCAWLMERYCQ